VRSYFLCKGRANGLRYPRVGGVWTRFEGRKSLKPEKCLKMPHAKRSTRQVCVHAVLGGVFIVAVWLFISN